MDTHLQCNHMQTAGTARLETALDARWVSLMPVSVRMGATGVLPPSRTSEWQSVEDFRRCKQRVCQHIRKVA